jgi:hypothetical protein
MRLFAIFSIHARITQMNEIPPKITQTERVEFMRRIHLFYRLEEDHFGHVAKTAREEIFQPGEVIIRQGEISDSFFMIFTGSVKLIGKYQHEGAVPAKLVAGDYFGEESLLAHHRWNETIVAIEGTVLLVLAQSDCFQLFRRVPQLKANFAVAATSNRLARSMHFSWLRVEAGEVIYFLSRKHPILLWQALGLPVILGMLGLVGILVGFSAQITWLLWLSVAVVGFMVSLGIWNGVDWGNDYYIVTNERVVWLEKIVGIYDSRQEAPLSAIQRINVQTDLLGRQLDFGTLIVRTIVGSILTLHYVNHPYQAAALIDEYWKRSKRSSRKMEQAAMQQSLRDRLLQNQTGEVPAAIPSLIQKADPEKKSLYGPPHGLGNFFRVRFEDLSTITYRKHWVVLIEKIWIPSLVFLGLLFMLVYEIIHLSLTGLPFLFPKSDVLGLLTVWMLLVFIVLMWWIYQYVDWSNDIFQVTPDQILDINKKPLGQVTSDIASLDNILHLEYERRGILQVLFNYGNVYITIGGGIDMTFQDLFNPSAVQDDIERRRLERISKKEQEAVKADRERMVDWFAAYQQSSEELSHVESDQEDSGESGEAATPDDAVGGSY